MRISQTAIAAGALMLMALGFSFPDSNGEIAEEGATTELYAEARPILDSYGGTDVRLNIVEPKLYCGDEDIVVACATLSGGQIYLNTNLPESDAPLKSVVAHEYIHTLTSYEEAEWLRANVAVPGVSPLEVVADCGVSYFVAPGSDDYAMHYMGNIGCTPELTAVAGKVIYDQRLD